MKEHLGKKKYSIDHEASDLEVSFRKYCTDGLTTNWFRRSYRNMKPFIEKIINT